MKNLKSFVFLMTLTLSLSAGAQVYDYYHYVNSLSVNERNKEALKQMAYLAGSCGYGALATAGSAVWRTLPVVPAMIDHQVYQRRDFEVADVAGGLVSAMTDAFYYFQPHPSLVEVAFRRTRETIYNGLTGSHSPCQTAYSNLMTIRDLKLQYETAQSVGPAINDDERNTTPRETSRTTPRRAGRKATSR